jgi:hypothetical protein
MLAHVRFLRFFGNMELSLLGCLDGNEDALLLASFSIKNGSEIRFWEVKWLGSTSLRK